MVPGKNHHVSHRRQWIPDESNCGQVRVPGIDDVEPVGHPGEGVERERPVFEVEQDGDDEVHTQGEEEDDASFCKQASAQAASVVIAGGRAHFARSRDLRLFGQRFHPTLDFLVTNQRRRCGVLHYPAKPSVTTVAGRSRFRPPPGDSRDPPRELCSVTTVSEIRDDVRHGEGEERVFPSGRRQCVTYVRIRSCIGHLRSFDNASRQLIGDDDDPSDSQLEGGRIGDRRRDTLPVDSVGGRASVSGLPRRVRDNQMLHEPTHEVELTDVEGMADGSRTLCCRLGAQRSVAGDHRRTRSNGRGVCPGCRLRVHDGVHGLRCLQTWHCKSSELLSRLRARPRRVRFRSFLVRPLGSTWSSVRPFP